MNTKQKCILSNLYKRVYVCIFESMICVHFIFNTNNSRYGMTGRCEDVKHQNRFLLKKSEWGTKIN